MTMVEERDHRQHADRIERPQVLFLDPPESDETRAAKLVINRGRSYRSTATRTLQVFSTNREEVALLRRVYGGQFYPHSSGYQWTVSKLATLQTIARSLKSLANVRPERKKMLAALFSTLPPDA
jgi:hypothetical protein